MQHEHDKPASFHASPQDACRRRPRSSSTSPACTRAPASRRRTSSPSSMPRGPDRPRDADAERRRRAAPLRLEPLQLRLPRPRSLAPDRARVPLVAHPHRQRRRRPAPAADREGDRAGGARARRPATRGRTRSHCMPGDNIVISMLGDADGNGAGGFAVLDAKTFEVKGRWENGGATPPLNYDFWYQPRKNVLVSSEFGEPNAYEPGFDLDDVTAGRYGSRLHFWNLAERELEQTVDLGENGLVPLEVRWLHDPEAERGVRRRRALEHDVALPPRERRLGRRPGDRRRERRARGLAVPGARADHRPRALDGRPLPLLLELAARRPAPVRRLRPGQPEADRPALARRRARQAGRRRPRAERRAADAPALARRAPALRHQLALLDLGQPVLPGPALVAAARELRPERRHGGRPRLLRRLPRPPGGPARAHEVRLQGGDCTTEIFQ